VRATLEGFSRLAVVRCRPGFTAALRRARWRALRRAARIGIEARPSRHPSLTRRIPEKARVFAALMGHRG
jgi:hypothetical protein